MKFLDFFTVVPLDLQCFPQVINWVSWELTLNELDDFICVFSSITSYDLVSVNLSDCLLSVHLSVNFIVLLLLFNVLLSVGFPQ